jgi:adenosine deaminase
MNESRSDDDTRRTAAALPKVLLHEHLDGGLRVATLLALARRRGVAVPAADAAALAAWFDANAHAGSLEKYLEGFALTVAAMADEAALEQVAFEAAEDARLDGAVLAEFRIAPLLFEPLGVAPDAAVAAMLRGLARSALPTGLIVCAMRNHAPELAVRAAELALRWRTPAGGGPAVIGFDLAGAEFGHPVAEHGAALALCREAGLPLTLHAGEADAAERVLEAVRAGARRIGHGVRLADAIGDPVRGHLVEAVIDAGAHLEICPTSNVHTGAAASMAAHPIVPLWRAGVSLSYHTDNRLMSCITHSGEAQALLVHTPLQSTDLLAMARQAAAASFLPAAQREAAVAEIDRRAAAVLAAELARAAAH